MFSPLIWLAVFPEAQGSRASGPRTQRFWYNTKIRRTIQRPVANSDMVRHGSPPFPVAAIFMSWHFWLDSLQVCRHFTQEAAWLQIPNSGRKLIKLIGHSCWNPMINALVACGPGRIARLAR